MGIVQWNWSQRDENAFSFVLVNGQNVSLLREFILFQFANRQNIQCISVMLGNKKTYYFYFNHIKILTV